jgi:small neutral amino acid transporter SnatA (MarC family)
MRPIAAFLAAVNPAVVAAALASRVAPRVVAVAAAGAAGVAIVAAAISDGLLDLLDVSAPTFEVAAGAVLGVASIRWVLLGAKPLAADAEAAARWRAVFVPVLVPLLLTPQLVAVSVSVGADDGVATAALGAVIALATAWAASLLHGIPLVVWSTIARLVAMVGVAVALAMIVDGVKTV